MGPWQWGVRISEYDMPEQKAGRNEIWLNSYRSIGQRINTRAPASSGVGTLKFSAVGVYI